MINISPNRKTRLIIRTPNHLGDCLMALPSIKAVAGLSGSLKISLLTPRWAQVIFEDIPSLDFVSLESGDLHGPGGILSQVRSLWRGHYEAGILLTPSFSSALSFRLAGVKRRIGYKTDRRKFLLTDPIPQLAIIVHRSRQYHRLMEYFAGRELPTGSSRLESDPVEPTKAEEFLKNHGLDLSHAPVAIAPQAVAESRRWGTENYAGLARRILDTRGGQIVLIGTVAEFEAGKRVRGDREKIINLCGATDIAMAGAILKRCALFIGNDSGLAHLAAAVNIPLVVLSGADNPLETSPLSERKTVIIKDELECISCVKNVCPQTGDRFMKCMREITVEEVFEAALPLLGRLSS